MLNKYNRLESFFTSNKASPDSCLASEVEVHDEPLRKLLYRQFIIFFQLPSRVPVKRVKPVSSLPSLYLLFDGNICGLFLGSTTNPNRRHVPACHKPVLEGFDQTIKALTRGLYYISVWIRIYKTFSVKYLVKE